MVEFAHMFAPKVTFAPTIPTDDKPSFSPVFQQGVQAWAFNIGQGMPVNPKYCLSQASAETLQTLLKLSGADGNIIYRSPFTAGVYHGVFTGMENPDGVPWFAYSDGTLSNAGQLADYWTHGYNEGAALRNALQDIRLAQQMTAQGVF